MARYIDIDHLIFELNHKAMWQGRDAGFNTAIQITHAQPIADVVEVVRCSKCKQWIKNSNLPTDTSGFCFYHYIDTNENGFCNYGDRRDT